MAKKDQYRDRGPGNTFWLPGFDGGIAVCRHNEEAWVTRFIDAYELKGLSDIAIERLCRRLEQAYIAGMADQREKTLRVLGIDPRKVGQ